MATIAVVGAGYVGLVTGLCFADLGNRVACVDIDEDRVRLLSQGKCPIYEPGLEELLERNLRAGRVSFTTDYAEALGGAEFIFIAVNTPSGPEGEADMHDVEAAAESIGRHLDHLAIIVNKSTMPIGASDRVAEIIASNVLPGVTFSVVSNPEFLREGSAINDFLHPDRIVLGSSDRAAAEVVAELHRPLKARVIVADLRTAEMIKYASNAFLATRISFINEISAVCEKLGADIKEVAAGMGADRRIGPSFLEAGVGYGGSCFPKDVRALAHMASIHGAHPQLLRAVMEINRDARRAVVQKARRVLGTLSGRTIGVLGLAFKPNTDDLREAPALEIVHLLRTEGAHIRAYDPAAMEKARRLHPELTYCCDGYEAAAGAHALILVTEWNEFQHLDMRRVRDSMAFPFLIDGRNVYDPGEMVKLGFVYSGAGRGAEVHGLGNEPPLPNATGSRVKEPSASAPTVAGGPR